MTNPSWKCSNCWYPGDGCGISATSPLTWQSEGDPRDHRGRFYKVGSLGPVLIEKNQRFNRRRIRSWDEDRHTLRRPGLGEVFATLVNASLNALRLAGWFPANRSMPLRAKSCAFSPADSIARLSGSH